MLEIVGQPPHRTPGPRSGWLRLDSKTKPAARVALAYAAVGAAWVVLSDELLIASTHEVSRLARLDALKDVGFVLLTAAILFFIFLRQSKRNAEAQSAVRRHEALYSTLARLNRMLAGSDSRQAMLDEACKVTADHVGFKLVWVGELDPESKAIRPVACAGLDADYINSIRIYADTRPEGRGPVGTCVREGRTSVFNDFAHDLRSVPWQARAAAHGVRSVAAVPLHVNGSVWGAFTVYAEQPNLFQDKEIALLEEVAAEISGALDNLDRSGRHREAESALERRERLLSTILHTAQDGFIMADAFTHIVEVNDAYCAMSGYSREELLRMTIADLEASLSAQEIADHLNQIEKNGSEKFETRHRHKDGSLVDVEVSVNFLPDSGGMTVGFIHNVTVEKRAENALCESEERFRSMAETVGDMFWIAVPDRPNLLYVSPAFDKIWGWPRAELYANPTLWMESIYEEDLPHVIESREAAKLGKRYDIEFRIHHPDGTTRWINARSYPRLDADGRVVLRTGIARDVTAYKLVESELRKLSRAVEQSPVSIVITDLAGNIEYVNPRFSQVTGYGLDEIRGQNPRILKSDETPRTTYEQLWGAITRGDEWCGELRNRRKNGELFWEYASISAIVDDSGRVTNYLAVKEDITERKRLEDQYRQSQKMEAIGLLAGGVAHDFNNLLQVISGFSETLACDALTEESRQAVLEIQAAADRAADLTRQLLAFSRRQTMLPRDLDLNDVVSNTARMLQRILGEDITLQVNYAPQSLTVHADRSMLDQVLLNLAVNSRDAMPDGGRLIVETSAVEVGDRCGPSQPGAYTCLRVSDSGCGIPDEVLPHIFEPFFSTKQVGKGTGLGLATVYGIVQQHGGWVEVQSKEGRGTSFLIYLPRLEAAATPAAGAAPLSAVRGGTETVLLVEDEISVRRLMHTVLARFGYNVLEADNGVSAMEMWRQHAGQVQLLLTDVVMPHGVSGVQLARQLQHERPELPVIYMSGYSPDLSRLEVRLEEGVNFLAKPCRPQRLLQVIRERLDHGPAIGVPA